MPATSTDQQSASLAITYGVLSREQRKQMFGIDCPEELEWRHWNPGTEYVKQLVVKNVSTSVLKMRFKQPASKAFSMDFPEPFKLRPGMSQSLKVVFRPIKMQHYSENVELFVGNSSFLVPVHAYTPVTHIEVPPSLDFGFTPTKETVSAPLVVKNSGDVRVDIKWRLEPPFVISPPAACLAPGEALTFTVAFTPPEACSYSANAACELESGAAAVCKISGIGKFPYLSVEQAGVDFGPVVVGQRVERTVRFGNHSVVPANFTINHDEAGPDDGVFTVGPARGTLGPEEYSALRVSYTPRSTGTFSSENFLIGTLGGNTVTLNLRGTAVAPTVTLSARAFNFGNVAVGTPASRVLYIRNHSVVPVPYDFAVEPLDVFAISRVRGVLGPETTAHVTLTFKAAIPANYWRRVHLLLKDADPQGVDLLATAYSEKSRPPPLSYRHIERYLSRVATGAPPVEETHLESLPPSAAGGLYVQDGEMTPPPPGMTTAAVGGEDPAGAGATGNCIPDGTLGGTIGADDGSGSAARLPGPDGWPLVFSGQDPAGAVVVDTDLLDFGSCSRLSAAEYRSVTVTNTTPAKLTAFIIPPDWLDPGAGPGEPARPVFQVFPESADIRPRGQVTFKVAFRPTRDAAFFCQQLLLVAHVKSQRNFRLVMDHQMLPSWSIELRATGNTFLHSNPEFSPKVELSTRHISFPPCRPGEQVHQTLLIANSGDTPAAFSFGAAAALAPLFTVRPVAGVVPPKGHVLIALRFSPTDTRPAAATTLVNFNGVASNAVQLALRGCAHTPRLTTDLPSSTLYFRPTCVGASSQRAITLHNPSRVPLGFHWRLPPRLQGLVTVTPASGSLRGNESVQLVWIFAPAAQKLFEGRAVCEIVDAAGGGGAAAPAYLPSGEPTGADSGSEAAVGEEEAVGAEGPAAAAAAAEGVTLSLVGEGTQGAVALDPPVLELGDLRVGHPVRRPLVLQNVSDGVLRYRLEVVPAADDEQPASDATSSDFTTGLDAAALAGAGAAGIECWVDEPEGALPARASKTVTVTLFPRYRKRYSLQVRCRSSTVAPVVAGPGRPPSAGRLGGADGASGADADAAAAALPPPVIAPLTAAVTFPTLEVTDVYCEGLPKQLLWQLLGLNDLNHHLLMEVTETEHRLRVAQDRGALTTDAACAAMRPFPMDFGIHPLGGRPRCVHVEISNPTPLPVAWQLHSFDDPDGVELENWVEPSRPRSEAERMRDLISEHKLFEIRPRHGSLESGARSTVTVEFRPLVPGAFELPVFLHVTDGKRLRLQLQATATPEPLQLLALPPPLRTFLLEPVALGDPQPPLQMYTLRCGGPVPLRWRLDTAPLAALAAESWGHRVLELVGPEEGEIPVAGVAAVNWRFSPLEAKEYRVRVPVLLGDGGSEVIELVGRGFAPPPMPPHGSLPAVPVSEGADAADAGLEADAAAAAAAGGAAADRGWAVWQGLSDAPSAGMAGRLALVDHDLVSLGVTPLRGLTRRIIVLTNKSRYPLAFDWDLAALAPPPGVAGPPLPSADLLTGRPLQGALAITPASGSLEPGERLVCRVALHAGVTPQLFEGEVRCLVRVDDEAIEEAQAAVGAAAAAAAAAEANLVERVEEVIAENPARSGPPPPAVAAAQRASRLRRRLPVHANMTTAIRSRIEPLATQFNATMEARTRRAADAARAGASFPDPQVICVTLTGRILDPEQLAALRYVPPHERPLARAAVTEGACWVPPTMVPFWEAAALPPLPPAAQPAAAASSYSNPLQRPTPSAISLTPTAADWLTSTARQTPVVSVSGGWAGLDPGARGGGGDVGSPQPMVANGAPPPPDLNLNLSRVQPASGPATPVLTAAGSSSRGGARTAEAEVGVAEVAGSPGSAGAAVVDVTFGAAVTAAAEAAAAAAAAAEGVATPSRKSSKASAGTGEDVYGGSSGGSIAAGGLSYDDMLGSGAMGDGYFPSAPAAADAAAAAAAAAASREDPLAALPPIADDELAPPPLPPPPPTGGSVDYDALVSARNVLTGLFSELLDDPDLRRALEFLPPEEIPVFAEVRGDVAPCYDPRVRPTTGAASTSASFQEDVDALSAAPDAAAAAAGGDGPSLERELEADPELRRVLVSPEWRTLADFVLESAVLGLMQESAAGDWEMEPEEGSS